MIRGIDHIVILVGDLEEAIADYRAAGFNAFYGGEHTDGATHNALVVFEDGAYLELLAFKREEPRHRWWRHVAAGEGLIDFALTPSSTSEVIAVAQTRGLDMDGPRPGGRQRPDGQEVRWEIGMPTTPELPFLCGDVTPRALRVPEGQIRQQENGVVGIDQVVVAVEDFDTSAARYAALLGGGGMSGSFHLGASSIILRIADDPIAAARLVARGPGICALRFRVEGSDTPVLDKSLLHGVSLA